MRKTILSQLAMLALLAMGATAQDTPYMLRDAKANQDLGALNQDMRELSNQTTNKIAKGITPASCPSGQTLSNTNQRHGGVWGGSCLAVGDVFLASTQTFTGQNTFNQPITVSSAATSVTAANRIYKDSFIKAWVVFSGTTTAIIQSQINVSSVIRNSAGDYTITWGTPFASPRYVVSCLASSDNTGSGPGPCVMKGITANGDISVSTAGVITTNFGGTKIDAQSVYVMAIGGQ